MIKNYITFVTELFEMCEEQQHDTKQLGMTTVGLTDGSL
jgi:hypothetical protein